MGVSSDQLWEERRFSVQGSVDERFLLLLVVCTELSVPGSLEKRQCRGGRVLLTLQSHGRLYCEARHGSPVGAAIAGSVA